MQTNNKKVFFIFLIFSIIISFSHIFVGSLFHSITSQDILLENGKELILQKEKKFRNFLLKSENIIRSTKESTIFKHFITQNEKKEDLEDLFLITIKSNDDFMQLRYIDENGQEIIKVERVMQKDTPIVVPFDSLQNKANRDYFVAAKKIKNEQVWFSALELNMENNKIQIPYKPTIRAVSSVYNKGKFKGILIINYFANDLLEELVYEPGFKVTLVDELGFIISNYDATKNWGFYQKEKYNIHTEYHNDAANILVNTFYSTNEFVSKSFDLALFDNIFIILKVDENELKEQKRNELEEDVFLSLIYFLISMILSFIVFKILRRLFLDLNTQIDTVDRLELASDIANIALWEYEAKTQNVFWSQNIKSILKRENEISYADYMGMIPAKEREIVEQNFFESIGNKKEFLAIHKMKIDKNTTKVLQEKGQHFYDSFGQHIKSVGCTYDISEKHESDQLKDKIIKQNKKFERLFKKFDESVIASTTNLRGIITYTSQAFCKISGYSREELVGSPQSIVRHPDSSSEVFTELWATIKQGKVWKGELKNKNKDGTFYWVYAVIYPEYNEDEKLFAYTAVRQDITALKKVKELNKNIKSSLEVASFIQESLLPTEFLMNSFFSDKFIIWEPKDVVGGDIYFLEKLRNEDECLLMVIDCTGHGVPGAFVTMLIKAIEKQLFQKIMNTPELEINPARILQFFNKGLKEILKQEKRNLATNVGFDGGIIYFNKKKNIIKYAGAANTLVYYDKTEIKTIKGDRHSIGYKNIDTSYKFKNHEIQVEKGMKFYLFSDGYIDQIGGDKNRSFSKSRMIDIVDKNKDKPMDVQKEVLLQELKEYQNGFERIDDVTYIAVEI